MQIFAHTLPLVSKAGTLMPPPLSLRPGQVVLATVVQVYGEQALVRIGEYVVRAALSVPLEPGARVWLQVQDAAWPLVLRVLPPLPREAGHSGSSRAPNEAAILRALGLPADDAALRALRALAAAELPVTREAVETLRAYLVARGGTLTETETSAALAALLRGLPLTPATVEALHAFSFGPGLAALWVRFAEAAQVQLAGRGDAAAASAPVPDGREAGGNAVAALLAQLLQLGPRVFLRAERPKPDCLRRALRLLGLELETTFAARRRHGAPEEENAAETLKGLLLRLLEHEASLSEPLRQAAQQLLRLLVGQQLALLSDPQAPFVHAILQLPLPFGDPRETATLHVAARKEGAKVDADCLHLYLSLPLPHCGDTAVAADVYEGHLTVTVWTRHPGAEDAVHRWAPWFAERLAACGFRLRALRWKPLDGDPEKTPPVLPAIIRYKGVDVRV